MKYQFLMVLVGLGGCSKGAPGEPAQPARAAAEVEVLPSVVSVSPKVVQNAGIRSSVVTFEPLVSSLDLVGETGPDPDKKALVTSPATGWIEHVFFHEGQHVKQGQILAHIHVPELSRARSSNASLQSRALAARKNAERLSVLSSKRLAANQEVLAAQSEAQALEAEAEAASEQVRAFDSAGAVDKNLGVGLALRSPLSGVVVSRSALVGQAVAPNQAIAVVVDLNEVWFFVQVFEKDLALVHVNDRAEVKLNAYPDEIFEGTVHHVGDQVMGPSRVVEAHIHLKNRNNLLKLGLFGTAVLQVGVATAPVLLVPQSAVVDIDGQGYVFVEKTPGEYAPRAVTLGRSVKGRSEVLKGLIKDERVVTDGALNVKSVMLRHRLEDE